jgi:hypothetical protein
VDIDDLGHRRVLNPAMGPQTEDVEVLPQQGVRFEGVVQHLIHFVNSFQDEVDLHPEDCRPFVSRMAVESRQCWYHDNYSKFLLIFVCPDDPVRDGLCDSIAFRDEKLVFNIDELFGVLDEIEVGVANRMFGFVVFKA